MRNGIKWKRRKYREREERKGSDRQKCGATSHQPTFFYIRTHTHTHTVTLFEADIVWTKCVEMSAAILG